MTRGCRALTPVYHDPSGERLISKATSFPVLCVLLLACLGGCQTTSGRGHCPAQLPAGPELPYERPAHRLADYWLRELPLDEPALMHPAAIRRYNRQQHPRKPAATTQQHAPHRYNIFAVDSRWLSPDAERSLSRLRKAILQNKRFNAAAMPAWDTFDHVQRAYAQSKAISHALDSTGQRSGSFSMLIREAPLRCYPVADRLYESPNDLAFDLAQCAQLRAGEWVRVTRQSGDYRYVISAYSRGWVRANALSVAVSQKDALAQTQSKRFSVVVADRVGLWSAPEGGRLLTVARLGLRLALANPEQETTALSPVGLRIYGRRGAQTAWVHAIDRNRITLGYSPLSRAAFFRRAFRLLHTPYGWGGMGAHRDCSRLLMDLFGSFGLELPRNSKHQSEAGVRWRDVSALDDAAKTAAIAEAAKKHIVLLYMPGHIMLYLGQDKGRPFAFHLFSGYLKPCANGGETMRRVNRSAVTSLELGRGSSRKAFIQRITRLVLFGAVPRPATAPKSK